MRRFSGFLLVLLLVFPLKSEIIVKRDENGNIIITNKLPKETVKKNSPPQNTGRKKRDFEALVENYASKYGIDKDLVHAVIQVESDYNPLAISKKGAMGLMQLHPEIAKDLRVHNPFDIHLNLKGGIKYLKEMLDRYGDLPRALAAYNAGPKAVDRYKGIPPYKETQNYVRKVLSIYKEGDGIARKTIIYKYERIDGEIVISNIRPPSGTYRGEVQIIK
ncbi:MAG: lytic transglycosylase domain-containing protein [Candidatus Aminicenantia bacterium]